MFDNHDSEEIKGSLWADWASFEAVQDGTSRLQGVQVDDSSSWNKECIWIVGLLDCNSVIIIKIRIIK